MVILLLRKEHDETRQVVWGDVAEQEQGRHRLSATCTGHEDGQQQASRIDQQMPRAAVAFLAPIRAARGASQLGGLDRLTVDAHGTGGGLAPRGHARAFAQGLDHLGPGSVVAPLCKLVIDRALGQHSMRPPVPLAPTPVEREHRLEDFPHVDRPWVPAAWARRGRRAQRGHDGPWLVRQLRGLCLARTGLLRHGGALLFG